MHGAEEALLAHAPPRLAVGDAVVVPRGDLGLDLARREAPELRAEHLVLFAEQVTLHGRSSCRLGVSQARPIDERQASGAALVV